MELRIKQSPAELKLPLPRLHPKIHLTRCEYCNGTGRSLVRYMGRVTESTCSQCVGRGSIVGEA
jgi:DnaJ-class molecular chaperone